MWSTVWRAEVELDVFRAQADAPLGHQLHLRRAATYAPQRPQNAKSKVRVANTQAWPAQFKQKRPNQTRYSIMLKTTVTLIFLRFQSATVLSSFSDIFIEKLHQIFKLNFISHEHLNPRKL